MPKKQKGMTESELVAFLGNKIHQAMNDEDGDLSDVRQESLNYYLGKAFGNERDGYSSYVSREVLEAIEWAKPSIIRVFTAGDKVVQFDPVTQNDEAQADIETDTINHLLLKQNDGFEVMYQWITDALMYPNGYVKVWVDESTEITREKYQGITEIELAQLVDEDGVEVLEQDSEVVDIEGQQVELFKVKIERTDTKPRLNFEAVAPEQVLVDNDLTSQDLDQADIVIHRVRRTYTWLVNNGYDRDKLDSVGGEDDHQWQDERVNRLFYEDENPDTEDQDDPSMRQYWVHECYAKVDYDGDGVGEGRKITMIGGTIFENEEWDYQPFVSMSSIILSHKHTGLSLADIVKDLQLISSTLWRQLLDNTYKLNIRRKYVGEAALTEDGATIEALTDTTAEFIPCRDPMAIKEEVVQPIINDLLPVIQGMTDQGQVRSGVSPNLSLDPDVLQKSTLGAFSAALEQASQRVELITRVFAETGMKRLFRKAHRACREFMDHELQFKIGDEWVNVDPSDWRDRTTVTVNAGLGFNDKATKIQLLASLLEYQKEALGIGMATPQNIYNTMRDMVEASGLGDVSQYFTDPATMPPQEPQPDPQMELIKAQMQIEQGKLQQQSEKIQLDAQKAQLDLQEKAAKMQAESEKWQEELAIKRQELRQREIEMLYKQHQHDQDIEAKLIGILAQSENAQAQAMAKDEAGEELSELDQAALSYLRGGQDG